ncbi:MAG: hypothetical protein IPH09_05060 [bacterium]|nr:hypothetical protein [bacterium]
MPGISGIIDTVGSLADRDSLRRGCELVHELEGIRLHHVSATTADCVIVLTSTGLQRPPSDCLTVDNSRGTRLVLHGEIFNERDLRSLAGEAVRAGDPLGAVLLCLFGKFGAGFIQRVNGEFTIAILQEREGRLLVFSDHLASKPFYYATRGTALVFGSEKKSILPLLGHAASLDPVGLLQVFVHSHNVGQRTFIREISSQPPASVLEYDHGRLRLTRYTGIPAARGLPTSTGSLIEAWCEQLAGATQRRLDGKTRVALSLSGGLDSRAVAAAIPATCAL